MYKIIVIILLLSIINITYSFISSSSSLTIPSLYKIKYDNNIKMSSNDLPKTLLENYQNQLSNSMKAISLTLPLTLSTLVLSANAADDTIKKTKKPKVKETELGIKYIELKKGDGVFPFKGDYVVIDYTGFLPDGKAFDTTIGKGKKPDGKPFKPLAFRFNENQMIPGIESVLENLQPGAEVTATIPAKYAYGEKGVCTDKGECLIPPNTNLNYFIRLKSVGAGFN